MQHAELVAASRLSLEPPAQRYTTPGEQHEATSLPIIVQKRLKKPLTIKYDLNYVMAFSAGVDVVVGKDSDTVDENTERIYASTQK